VALKARRAWQARIGGPTTAQRNCLTPPHHRLERWVLPLEISVRARGITLLHSLDHVAPAWGGWRSVVTLHDLAFVLYPETHSPKSRTYYAATAESVRRAQRVIAVSQRTASDAVRLLGVDPVRVRVVPEAAGPAFRPRPHDRLLELAKQLGLAEGQPYVLFVGTLEPRKNVPLLVEAFARLRKRVNAQLVVVGARGWQDETIMEARVQEGVRFVGWLGEEDLAVLYSHAGVLALPSLYEGFGLPVLEAMACGAPVVCSNAGPLPEVAGDAAVLLPPTDAATWADTLQEVLTNPSRAAELRRRGFLRAAAFSWRRTAELTRDVYREALLA
jgi:glycosyltransferase involved in cell wall biosynthesis